MPGESKVHRPRVPMGTTFQKKFPEGTYVGSIKAFDPLEDLYEIVYDDYAAEELTWSDLQKLLGVRRYCHGTGSDRTTHL